MKFATLILTGILLTSCNSPLKEKITTVSKGLLLRLPLANSKFKYHNLKEFSIDTISWDKRKLFYTQLDSISFFQIYQDPSLEYLGQYDDAGDFDFFYSNQNNSRGLIELTVLTHREGEYCDGIRYLIYNKKGKLISSFSAAGSCADGGFYEKDHGSFVNDSTYILFSEDNYDTKDVDKSNTISYSKHTTTIKSNGETTILDTLLRQEIKPYR